MWHARGFTRTTGSHRTVRVLSLTLTLFRSVCVFRATLSPMGHPFPTDTGVGVPAASCPSCVRSATTLACRCFALPRE
jgi:hypothetical protein